jgi:RNA polymerase-binding protein DksA
MANVSNGIKKKIEYYKKILLKIKQDIVHDIGNMSEINDGSNSDAGHVMHMADVATDMYDREFSLGLASNEREVLSKIEKALARIQQGTYGLCSECSKPIATARLEALPYVETCVKCQEDIENRRS